MNPMIRLARFLAPVLLTAVALLTVPATAPAAAAQACADDWIANAGNYDNPDHLNVVDVTTTGGDVEYLYKGTNSNGRAVQSKYYTVPSGWDILGWDNRTSTPTWRRNSTGTFLIPDQICGGVYWFKGVRNGAAMDRAPMGAAVSAVPQDADAVVATQNDSTNRWLVVIGGNGYRYDLAPNGGWDYILGGGNSRRAWIPAGCSTYKDGVFFDSSPKAGGHYKNYAFQILRVNFKHYC